MPLVKSPEMTEENRAAPQASGRQSPGPARPEGKDHSAIAHGRHGFSANPLMKVRRGGLTQKDVKNADRSGDMHENKGTIDKMSQAKSDFCAQLNNI